MSLLAPERLDAQELIDATGHDLAELRESLRQVARVDRLLGGERGVRRALAEVLAPVLAEPADAGVDGFTLLDVGAGIGEVADRLAAWLRGRVGGPVRALAVDAHPDVVAVGRAETPGLQWIRADGRRLPLPDRSVDVVVCVLTLHHFDRRGALRLLSEMARVARHRVILSDLERSRAHWLGARVLAATLWSGNRLTRADAPMSVLRGWTRPELEGLLTEAGLVDVRVRRHLPWRLVASAGPPPPGSDRR